ncbi:MAG TPA: chemotaxis protein CheW, partial [Cellvibrio sp.]|nr:chemotaxis protein CheW [Cellvibrio sp.]
MGLQPTPAGKIRTVNTAKFVMPERYDENFLKTARYVVSINGVPWGLAVDSVNQPITLMPDDVKWRSDRSKRPWLAGTVKDHMCALLDIPRIGQMLIEADKNFIPA